MDAEKTTQERADLPEKFLAYIQRGGGKALKMVKFLKELGILPDTKSFKNPTNEMLVSLEIIPRCNQLRKDFENSFEGQKVKTRRAVLGVLIKEGVFQAMEMSVPETRGIPKYEMNDSGTELIGAPTRKNT